MNTCIVVSGGDAPGINTAIATYARLAAASDDLALGARGGFAGLLADDIVKIESTTVDVFAGRGGSWLQSNRDPVLAREEARDGLLASLRKHQIDNLLLFGGDGTFRYIRPLLQSWGIACIALPTTIDNDVPGTDYTLGHDSACNYAWQTIEGIRATAHALPGRIFLVETLGGDSGYLALAIAYACLADVVLAPEYSFDMDWLAQRLKAAVARRGYALVLLSEGAADVERLGSEISQITGIRSRVTRLGHAQRGASVSHFDRRMAVDMSRLAYDAFKRDVRAGSVIACKDALKLQEGAAADMAKAPPDYQQYAFINGL